MNTWVTLLLIGVAFFLAEVRAMMLNELIDERNATISSMFNELQECRRQDAGAGN